MIEVMIPSFEWNGEDWCLKNVSSLESAFKILKYCDGNIPNVLLNCSNIKNTDQVINKMFSKYEWINKIMVKHNNNLVGIYQNKN